MKEKPKKSVRMWIAREKNGALFLFCEKPNTFNSLVLPKEAFPSVKWEDNEPTRVIIRLAQYDYKKKHFRKYTCHYQ